MADERLDLDPPYIAGDDVTLRFAVSKDGEPADCTGATAQFAVARRAGDVPVLTTEGETPTATVVWVDAENGIFQVLIDRAATQDLAGKYAWDAKVVDGAGDRDTVARGDITFLRPVVQEVS